ncbi:unnamed protein product [Arabis nemorensis]|uniref:Uncharacterized protein n=1 Tax=Arabis nemorensis TaxID=586526 RepID=A0A565BY76_9BRAS|nr:unnamed protein product [Arabis nemorensis]
MEEQGFSSLAPERHQLQCLLWDCQRNLRPCCNPDHEAMAVAGEINNRSVVVVDGNADADQLVISEKASVWTARENFAHVAFMDSRAQKNRTLLW